MNSDAHFTTAVRGTWTGGGPLKGVKLSGGLIANYHTEILKEYIPDLADFQG